MTLRLLPIGRALGLQVVCRPRCGRRPSTPVSHDGEDFFWVLSGEIVLTYGVDEYRLKKGQSVIYAGRVHHFFSNRGRRPAELLSITSPPYGQIAAAAEGR
jgi:mannose-6-phosphate isomerase-like protein (cupin superfamily)